MSVLFQEWIWFYSWLQRHLWRRQFSSNSRLDPRLNWLCFLTTYNCTSTILWFHTPPHTNSSFYQKFAVGGTWKIDIASERFWNLCFSRILIVWTPRQCVLCHEGDWTWTSPAAGGDGQGRSWCVSCLEMKPFQRAVTCLCFCHPTFVCRVDSKLLFPGPYHWARGVDPI